MCQCLSALVLRLEPVNPFETKRKLADVGGAVRLRDRELAEGEEPEANILQVGFIAK